MPGMSVALWAEVVLAVIEQALPTETAAVAGVDVAETPELSVAPLSKTPENTDIHSSATVTVSMYFLVDSKFISCQLTRLVVKNCVKAPNAVRPINIGKYISPPTLES